ncbi:uncharacterized protein [Drosophila suzukii]|uniref:Uncharacterized protein isoform X2 n=1 Tax=Drosophila suzukii TaxID=28584 RepID=A0ABM4TTI0_DROSZ
MRDFLPSFYQVALTTIHVVTKRTDVRRSVDGRRRDESHRKCTEKVRNGSDPDTLALMAIPERDYFSCFEV